MSIERTFHDVIAREARKAKVKALLEPTSENLLEALELRKEQKGFEKSSRDRCRPEYSALTI